MADAGRCLCRHNDNVGIANKKAPVEDAGGRCTKVTYYIGGFDTFVRQVRSYCRF